MDELFISVPYLMVMLSVNAERIENETVKRVRHGRFQ
jgi:hypothetical protein